jgi:hypothetical protein
MAVADDLILKTRFKLRSSTICIIAEILYKARCQADVSIYREPAGFNLVGIDMINFSQKKEKFWTKIKILFILKNYEVKSVVIFQGLSVLHSCL